MVVRDTEPVVFQNLELEEDGTIVVGLSKSDPSSRTSQSAPITVTSLARSGGFTYQSGGKLVISADAQDDPQGTYFVIDGNVNNVDQLAANTSLVYDCDLDSNADCTEQNFSGVGQSRGIETVFNNVYLQEGSLRLVVEAKENPILPGPNEVLPGCGVGSDLCDLIGDIPGDEDDALPEEEDVVQDVFNSLVDGVQDDDVELPLIDYGTLAELLASGLAPRNVDAAGRGLACTTTCWLMRCLIVNRYVSSRKCWWKKRLWKRVWWKKRLLRKLPFNRCGSRAMNSVMERQRPMWKEQLLMWRSLMLI